MELSQLYELFPKLEEKIEGFIGNHDLIDVKQPEQTCTILGLCEKENITSFLYNEVEVDLDSLVEHVNNTPNATWKARKNEKFIGATYNDVRSLMGTVVDPDWTVKIHEKRSFKDTEVPANFDSRVEWDMCAVTINHIRDQANCGSCWAHGTTEAFNDRMCIATGGNFVKLLSVADTTACCNATSCMSFGCNGGQVGTPWSWFQRQGVVTGGDYGDEELCFDYTMPQCAHHVDVEGLTPCEDIPKVAPKCKAECQTNPLINYADDKVKGASSYAVRKVEHIKQEIMEHGPVTGAFTVYEDFLTYAEGIYQHTSGKSLGGHAIKVIGWGVEDDVDYWLCVNSWNETWGDKGTFKILMGDCGINRQMHAGLAQDI